MISSRSAYGKTISCDYGGAALASAGGASAGGQEGFVASGEVEDGTGELDLTCQFGVGRPEAARHGCGQSAIMSASLTTRRSFRLDIGAGLGVAEHIAGTAEFQVGLGDFGTVERVVNHFEPLLAGEPGSAREIRNAHELVPPRPTRPRS